MTALSKNRTMVQASSLGPNKHKRGRLRYLGDFKQQALQNPEVKTEYDQLSPQYELIRQIIKLRQGQQLTQKGFAEKTVSPKVYQLF